MKDIKSIHSYFVLVGLIAFLCVVDSQCYLAKDACLPDIGYYISAPNVISDQTILEQGLAKGHINSEWKEKPGEVYGVITSKLITGNYHTFSIISSSLLLVVTYFLAYKISGNRLSSLLSVMVLALSRTFLWYSDSIPYPDFWALLFFTSLYPFKHKLIRPIAFITSFIMKAQTLAFLPILIIKEENKKLKLLYISIGLLTSIVAVSLGWVRYTGFNIGNLAPPYVVFEILLQDLWVIILFFPVCAVLFKLWRKKIEWSGILLMGMCWSLLFQYVLALFTSYGAFSERMLPFIMFFALSISLIISKKDLLIKKETRMNKEALYYISG